MGKNKSASNLINVIDFNNDRIAFISGSTTLMSISSSGAVTVTGVISGSNAQSASYALNAGLLNNKDSAEFTSTGSFNAYTSSNDATVTSVAGAAVSAVAGVNALAARTSSYTTTSSFNSYTASNNATMSCVSSTATSAIAGVGALAAQTGSYATTGSNTFVGGQYLSSSFNPTGFSTTASLYTDGGLRVSRDAYVSGTLYLNNLTVFGTQSVAYISSSQLNIGTNIINVNTDTPSVRFGGLAVYDSGSTGLTGSILWDSQNNHWVYSNPSGSSYSGGMFISGPRTSTLGSETGTTSCMLLAGQGGDHLTSSMIYHDSTVTCIPNTLIGSTVCANGNLLLGGAGTANTIPQYTSAGVLANSKMTTYGNGCYNVNFGWSNCARIGFDNDNTGTYFYGIELDNGTRRLNIIGKAPDGNTGVGIWTGTTSYSQRLNIDSDGIACFACQICSGASIFANTNIRVGTGTSVGNASDPAITSGGCIKAGLYFAGSCVALGSGGNSLLLAQNGNVGIRNITPRATLHIQQATNDGVPAVGCARDGLIISSNNGNYGLNIGVDPTGPTWIEAMRFDDGATAYNLLLQAAGRCSVLIGTGTALAGCRQQLVIGGNNFGSLIALGNNGNGNKFVIESDSSENVLINNKSNTPMIFYTNNSRRMDITGDGIACFACQVCAKSLTIGIDCSGVVVDVAGRHGLMKYVNYSTGLVGACSGTDNNISTWMGRFAGSIFAPTAVYQDLMINGSGKVTIATSCAAFGRNLTVQEDIVAYYSNQESITMGISAGTGAQSWGIQVCDTGDGNNTLHLNARGGFVGINKGAGNSANYPLDVTGIAKTTVLLVGSDCSPSAGINYLGREGYREKWLITQGRYRFCFGTPDFYGSMFVEFYGTNYNQGTSEVRVGKAAIPLRYGQSRSIFNVYQLGGVCVGAYLTNGIGLVWCNINDSVGDLIFTNAGSLQPDAVLATELHFLAAGYSLAGKFTRICYTTSLYDTVNPYV